MAVSAIQEIIRLVFPPSMDPQPQFRVIVDDFLLGPDVVAGVDDQFLFRVPGAGFPGNLLGDHRLVFPRCHTVRIPGEDRSPGLPGDP